MTTYIRENVWQGHEIGERYSCKRCGIAQNSWSDVGVCVGFYSPPPFSFSFGKPPSKNSKFCKSGHKRDKIKDLTDLDNLECNSDTVMVSHYLAMSKESGKMDIYRCSHCHEIFQDRCMHSMC